MSQPYRNNTLARLNDALTRPDLNADALPPDQERKARDLALRMVQESRWRSFATCLDEARVIVAAEATA